MNNTLVQEFFTAEEFKTKFLQYYKVPYNEKLHTSFGIYVGHARLYDTKGPVKVGRCTHVTALARGRSQGGADWFFDYFYPLNSLQETKNVEAEVKKLLKPFKIKGNQGQLELYNRESFPYIMAELSTHFKLD